MSDHPSRSTSEDNRRLIDSTAFSVSARVAMQLGRESISSSVTAILELVKNAYDADAEVVRIRFGNLQDANPFIEIEDDGRGMTAEDLKKNWMVIGTSNKLHLGVSKQKKRVLTGEKGLGRLGLDRLCSRTRLQSFTADAAYAVELEIDWQKYQDENSRLEEIAHPLFQISVPKNDSVEGDLKNGKHGTRLILEDLRDVWDEAAIAELDSQLSLLVSPFHGNKDFRVEIDTGGVFTKFDGQVAPDAAVLSNAYWGVVAVIDEHGVVSATMSSPLHSKAYQYPPTGWKDFVKNEGTVPACGPLRLEFYFFARLELDSAGNGLTRAKLNEFLKNNQGIRIYRDGFRVKPYGEPNGEGDWLKLGYRRTINPEGVTQGNNWKVGYNQVVGAVFLTREHNSPLIDQTNREGLVIGLPYRHLYIFAEKMLQFFEKHHQSYERERISELPELDDSALKASTSAADDALRDLHDLAAKLSQLTSTPTDDQPSFDGDIGSGLGKINETLTKSVKALEVGVKQANERRAQAEQEKNTLANLASLGILAACFGHETCGWTRTVQVNAGWLRRNLQSKLFMVMPDVEAQVLQITTDLNTDSKRLETFAAFALGTVKPDKRRQREFCVKKVALEVFNVFRDSLQNQKNIEFDVTEVPEEPCLIRGFLIDWECIFANLITNAMWAIIQNHGMRRVRLRITSTATHINIQFDDSGFGLEVGTESRVFDAGFSTRRNSKGETEGTGMGLFIVKSFVEENTNGTIQAFPKGDLGGACFLISTPRAPSPQN